MSLENELSQFLNNNLRELETKNRDIELILYFYGFKNDMWPTLDDAAIKYDVGDSEGRRSERPRQIIKNKFKDIVEISNLPSAKNCADFIYSQKIHRSDVLSDKLLDLGIMEGEVNLRGIVNILHDLSLCEDYEIYTPDLQKTTRNTYVTSRVVFLIEKDLVSNLRKALTIAKVFPGLLGIAKLSFLKQELSKDFMYFDELVEVLREDIDTWFYSYKGDEFYLMESRGNTLINNLEKIRCVTTKSEIDELTVTLSNSLKARTHKYPYPPDEVIKYYLAHSKYTKTSGITVTLNINKGELSKEIDKDIIDFMKVKGHSDYPSLLKHLVKKGYKKPTIDKSVFYSPLIHVDKTLGQAHHVYSIVGSTAKEELNKIENSKYDDFRKKLIAISIDGTDRDQESIMRKEQAILRAWLFDGKNTEICAICNSEYSVSSLVTAHKKKRANCAEYERTDPNIVMPLCYYGCDYIYEKGYIYIKDGEVREGFLPKTLSSKDIFIIKTVIGNKVHNKWLEGDASYFRELHKHVN